MLFFRLKHKKTKIIDKKEIPTNQKGVSFNLFLACTIMKKLYICKRFFFLIYLSQGYVAFPRYPSDSTIYSIHSKPACPGSFVSTVTDT